MNQASIVNITINGRQVAAKAGQTVMQAARAAGIEIPSLCDHPQLKPEGGCRVCLVEIEKQRALQPACTFPVFEGMNVQTESEKVVVSRTTTLQMIFSERSHYCMFCAASGSEQTTDCELQKLGYRYGMDHWVYPPDYSKPWPIDASRKYFVMEHARCILCRRCIRACDTIAGNHTLGVQQRGAETMICADDGLPFGDSSCVSCGSCLQVCPTGALMDRRGAYMGHEAELTKTKGACMGCAVACGIEAFSRDGQLVRVQGDWEGNSGGLLCADGRFEPVEPKPPRVLYPMIRQNGKLVETSWDKALTRVAVRFGELHRVAALASPRLTTQSLAVFQCFCHEVLETNEIGLLYGEIPPTDLGQRATLGEVTHSDCIAVIGGDPMKDQKALGYLVRRAFDNGAKIIVINDRPTGLDRYATLHLHLEELAQAAESPFERLRTTYHLRVSGLTQLKAAAEQAARPVVLYGTGLSSTVYSALRALQAKVRFLPLIQGTNTAGAARLGLHAHPVRGDALYVLAGDDVPNGQDLPQREFTVVQAAYRTRWTENADVVLPARTWAEREGSMVNVEGRTVPVVPLAAPPRNVQGDAQTLLQLSVRMGSALSYEEIAGLSASA